MLIFLLLTLVFTRLYALFNVGALFYQFEGLHRGWMAKEFLDGAGWWYIFNNPAYPNEGSSIIISYIASLFFLLFGDNFFSLTLVPILFSVLILTVFYLLLKRHFGLYAAIVFSFLFISPPPAFFQFSLLVIGSHFESILFSVLGLFCFFEIFFNESNYKMYLRRISGKNLDLLFILLGLISGFGIYFDYACAIMSFAVFFGWLLIDKRFFLRRHFYIFLAGFAIGFIPWLIYNTLHNFSGLSVCGQSLSSVIFSKSPIQMFQTLKYIVTNRLPLFLTPELYLTVVFSFVIVIILNFMYVKSLFLFWYKYLQNIKELFFIGYIIIYIVILSILYLPVFADEHGIPLWMTGLRGRLYHLYPFLFVLVALCFNKIMPQKKNKFYLFKIGLNIGMAILIISIGFSNYSKIFTTNTHKMHLSITKGYSSRFAYINGIKKITSYLDSDMFHLVEIANHDDEKLKSFLFNDSYSHSLYNISIQIQELTNDMQLNETKKPYYCLLLGLNTGDLMEGYDILNLNKLIIQKVPIQYRHYVYEGVAISLMNRRRDEIMKNIDFIENIPLEYRHYFLLELGRIIGSYPDDKIREEKLQYSIKRFPGIHESYIRRGLVESLANENLLKHQQRYGIQEKDLSYIYRAIARHFFGNLPLENDVLNILKNFKIDKNNERYYYWGVIEAYFKDNSVYQEDVVKNKIETIIKVNWTNKDMLYEGLGLSLGHLTFGYIKRFIAPLESSLDANQLSHFYYGYCISLKERYGLDSDMMKKLVDDNVIEEYKEMCLKLCI